MPSDAAAPTYDPSGHGPAGSDGNTGDRTRRDRQGGDWNGGDSPGAHALDARYHIPWFGGPVYLRVVLGRDRRPHHRSRAHASGGIRRSIMNVLLFALGACLIYTAVAAAILTGSAVLQ